MPRLYYGTKRTPLDLDQGDVIASGGEALVFRGNVSGEDRALKVYHTPDNSRSSKLNFFLSNRPRTNPRVMTPEEPLYARANATQIVGFSMPLLPRGTEPLAMLMRPDFCAQHGVTTKTKAAIFLDMLEGLLSIHAAMMVVGDLNDQNQCFDLRSLGTLWLDVDSWQFGRFPCMVGTENYLTPDLYGVDLSKRPMFKPEHDHYSYAVLLFRTLLMAHPFASGFHRDYMSLFDRAKHGLTILDSAVRYPKKANSPDMLTDELADVLLRHLKRQTRDPFPIKTLAEYVDLLIECSSCHTWYPAKRPNCPACATKTILAAKMAAKIAGCACETILQTPGKILYVQFVGDTLYCITDEDGTAVLYQKPAHSPLTRKELFGHTAGAQYAFFDTTLVACLDPKSEEPTLYLLDISEAKPRAITQSSTRTFNSTAVFGCSRNRLYRIAGSNILSSELFGDAAADRPVALAMNGQTWFTVANNPDIKQETLFGCHRVFTELQWFLITGTADGKSYKQVDVALAPLTQQESLLDVSVRFGARTALILRQTRVRGVDFVRLEQVRLDNGAVIQSRRTKISDVTDYENIHGKAYTDDSIVHPTDDGMVIESVGTQSRAPLSGTDAYVQGSSQLHRYGQGVVAITSDQVMLLTPQ